LNFELISMSQTLYRKYRPQYFKDVIGQNHIKITLENEIVSGQLAHAYLFTGPRGIGKTSLARIVAKTLNCQNRKETEAEPCNQCTSCQAINIGNALDLIEIDAATHTQVDKVRENIIENINFPPHGKYKVFIIDEVHMMSTAAFNALLKTLEEPPAFVVFILCTTEAYKLPETIISRCQRFDFKKVPAEQIVSKMKRIINEEKLNIDSEVLSAIALRSGGFIRDAESLLAQVAAILGGEKKQITMDDVGAIIPRSNFQALSDLAECLINNDAKGCLEIINQLVLDGVDLEQFNADLVDYWRKMMLAKMNLKNVDETIGGLPEDVLNKLLSQTEKISLEKIALLMEKFINLNKSIKEAEISQLPLEIAVVSWIEENGSIKKYPASEEIKKTPVAEAPKKKILENEKKVWLENPAKTDLAEIKKRWGEIIRESQKLNHSLPLVLKACYPVSFDNGILILGSEFELHIQKIKDHACVSQLEELLANIFQGKIMVKAQVINHEIAEKLKQEITPNEPIGTEEKTAEEIAKSFGGKVIE